MIINSKPVVSYRMPFTNMIFIHEFLLSNSEHTERKIYVAFMVKLVWIKQHKKQHCPAKLLLVSLCTWYIWRHLLLWILQFSGGIIDTALLWCYGYVNCAALRHHCATQFKRSCHFNSNFIVFCSEAHLLAIVVMTSNHTIHCLSVKDLWISTLNVLSKTMAMSSVTWSHHNFNNSNISFISVMWNVNII